MFLGFNNHTEQVLNLLGKYTVKNSLCELVIEDNKKNKTKKLNNLLVNYHYTKLIDRAFLNKINYNLYDYVIVQSSFNENIHIDGNGADIMAEKFLQMTKDFNIPGRLKDVNIEYDDCEMLLL